MKTPRVHKLTGLALLALAFIGAGVARAQYTVTGSTAGGGKIIIGNGTLGALSTATTPALSAGGFDNVTLNIGSMATAAGVDTIAFTTSNDTLLNNGTVIGANSTAGYNAISFLNSGGLSGETVTNNVTATGGNGSDGNGGNGIEIFSDTGPVSSVTVNNPGNATGGNSSGNGGDGGNGGAIGDSGGNGGNGGNGIFLGSDNDMSNVTLNNFGNAMGGNSSGSGGNGGTGSAIGGNGGASGAGGNGIWLNSSGNISGLTLTNDGSATGGNSSGNGGNGGAAGSIGGNGGAIGAGGNGIGLNSSGSISAFTLTNSGSATGGSSSGSGGNGGAASAGGSIGGSGGAGGAGGNGIGLSSSGNISGLALTNSGSATGGNSSGNGGNGGDASGGSIGGSGGNGGAGGNGIGLATSGNISDLTLTNSGSAKGGNSSGNGGVGAAGGTINGNDGAGGAGGNGISLKSSALVSNITVMNSGNATGGSSINGYGGYGIYLYSNNDMSSVMLTNSGNATGGSSGSDAGQDGIFLSTNNGGMSNVMVNNSGNATGGNGGGGNGYGGHGINVYSRNDMNSVTVNNSGKATGGNGSGTGSGGYGLVLGTGGAMGNVTVNNSGSATGGSGGSVGGDGINLLTSGSMSNVMLTNSGNAMGGNGGTGVGGDGISLRTPGVTNSVTLNNSGNATGGNSASGNAGAGIRWVGNDLTLNNFGAVTAGTGLSPKAIVITGNGNTLNLNGHSSVNGLISATGSPNSNILNLNFTGMSPTAIAALKAQLVVQGIPLNNGIESNGQFTVRGVTYTYDPLVVNLNLSSYQLQGLTPNQQAIGASLDSAAVNPALGSSLFKLFDAIDQSGNVPASLEQLSPQKYELFGDIALSNANLLSLEVDNRLNNLRDGSESVDTTGMGGSTDKVTSGYSKDDKAEAPVSSLKDRRWGFFASATGLRANLDGNMDLQSAAFTSVGLISGIDGKIGDDALIGLLFDYNNTSADLDNQGSTAKVESYSGGLYGAYHRDGFYSNSLLAYTRNDYNTARNILIPGFNQTATGSSHGNQYTVNIDGGYDHKISYRFTVGPTAGLQYVHLDTDGFNESGAGAASLAVGSQTVESLRSKLGVRANYHLQVDKDLAIALEVRAAWQHEFLDDSRSFNSSFINSGLSSFSVSTSKPQRDAAVVGIGIDATIADRFTVYVDYDVQAGQSGYIEHTFKGGCKISF